MELSQEIFELIFPQGVFEWFDLTEGTRDGDTTAITFEEKDLPPLTDQQKHQKIVARKFHHIRSVKGDASLLGDRAISKNKKGDRFIFRK